MLEYGHALIAEKRARPTDDMLSVVVHAQLDDEDPPGLTDDELYMFFSLLFAAGSETTRNAIAGGVHALVQHPDQLAALRDDPDLMGTAIEEVLRWTSPSPSKRRTATATVELGGHTITPGQKVVVWEGSANRDELAFPDADVVRRRARPEPAPRLRPRPALLPRRQPGPTRDAGDVRGVAGALHRASSPRATSSGPAATATPASATSPSP